MRIGFIGLGNMGGPMASNLCRKGFDVAVYDTVRERMAAPAGLGGREGTGVADVTAGRNLVITMLPDSRAVQDVIAGTDGVLAHIGRGAIVMDMSTIHPLVTDELAGRASAREVAFVDAPVGRLASHAARGESLFMVGAAPDVFERVKPVLEAMGTSIHYSGPTGTGIRTKLVNNYLAIISCQLNAEALALSQRFGLSLERTLEVLYGTTATNGQLKIAWPAKVLKGDLEPGFTIDLAHKDLSLIVETANALAVPMPVAAVAREAFSAARSRGYGSRDFSAVVDVLCEVAGIEKPRLGQDT